MYPPFSKWVQSAGVLLDRLFKMNIQNDVRARMGDRAIKAFCHFPSQFGRMVFLQGRGQIERFRRIGLKGSLRSLKPVSVF